jgi:hypothetical protein
MTPAIDACRARGIDVAGPFPATPSSCAPAAAGSTSSSPATTIKG